MIKALIIIAIILGFYLLHRLCLWLEANGWIYYINKKAENGTLGSTLQELNALLNPSVRHTIEMKQNQVVVRRNEAGSPEELMSTDEGKKYDLIASGFAEMRDSFSTEQKYIDLLIDHLKPNANILDVGCGSGFPIASYLIEHGFQVTGVDSSKKLLKIAEDKCPLMQPIFGDIRSVGINQKFDAIVEWWCLFHLPKEDHAKMIARFASWLKKGGILEFTTGDSEYQESSSTMLNQELNFYSLNPDIYEKYLKDNGFKLLLRESDQEQHLVWLAKRDLK